MDKTLVPYEDYAELCLEKDKDLQKDEIYFCWRWSCRHFPSQMKTGVTPPTDEAILEAILHSSAFSTLLVERVFIEQGAGDFKNPNRKRISGLLSFMLELYGDDPEHLGAMWSWAKSSGSVICVIAMISNSITLIVPPSRSPGSASHAPGMESFRDQLQRDYRHLSDSGWIISSRDLSQGLDQFLCRMYASSVKRLVAERTTALNLSYFREKHGLEFLRSAGGIAGSYRRNPNIVFSVAGSGKSQYLFDLLSGRWGIYLVSGRVPQREDSSLNVLDARKGASSCDTRHLCAIFDSIVSSINAYSEWHYGDALQHVVADQLWWALLENRYYTLDALRERQQDLTPHDWLLFQTVCTNGFDPFLDTFKLRIMTCKLYSFSVAFSAASYDGKALICFDEAQCEFSDRSEKQRQYIFGALIKGLHLFQLNMTTSPIVAAGTSLQFQHFREVLEYNVNELYEIWVAPYCRSIYKDHEDDDEFQAEIYKASKTVTDSDSFVNILRGHSRRLISKMDYLRNNSAVSSEYKLWEVFAISSQKVHKEDFYLKTKTLLGEASQSQQCVESVLDAFLAAVGLSDGTLRGPVLSYISLFHGRIRWSTMFIEQLLIEYVVESTNSKDTVEGGEKGLDCITSEGGHEMALYTSEDCQVRSSPVIQYTRDMKSTDATCTSTDTPINMESIAEIAAKAAQDVIVSQLQARLDQLKSKGEHLLLRDLYFTAVRADLMNKPCIMMDTESAQMVTEGFALLKLRGSDDNRSVLLQELAEPLTIRPIIGYLRKPEQMVGPKSRHARILEQLLFDVQDSGGAFGDMTEYYLGWTFAGLLSAQTVSMEKSKLLRDLLANAKLIPRSSASESESQPTIGSLDGYRLLEAQMAKQDEDMGVNYEFDDWLRRTRENKYFPTIYFPPGEAGPDIVFCLRHKDKKNDRILCALQVKTASSLRGASYFLLRTMDPNLWFSVEPERRRNLLDEISNHTSLRFITGLVTPSAPVASFLAPFDVVCSGLRDLREWIQRYNLITRGAQKPDPYLMQSFISDASTDFGQAQSEFKQPADAKIRKEALNKLGSTEQRDQAEGALLVIQHAARWLRVKSENICSSGAFRKMGVGMGHDFFFTAIDQTHLPGIFGYNYAELSKAMKLVSLRKGKA